MEGNGEGNGRADKGTELENGPKDAVAAALVLFSRVGHHDGTLGGPEQRRAEAQNGASQDQEPSRAVDLEVPERSEIESVTGGTNGKRQTRTENVLQSPGGVSLTDLLGKMVRYLH